MITKEENFVINCEEKDIDYIKHINLKEMYEKAKKFFNFDKELQIRLKLIYSIDEFEFYSRLSFMKWNVAFVGSPNMVYILSPESMEELSIHKKEEFDELLLHEIGHIFYGNRKFEKIPFFEEGIMQYFAQYKRKSKEATAFNLSNDITIQDNLTNFKDEKIFYMLSFITIKYLIENYGKEKLFNFLDELTKNRNKDFGNFSNSFKNNFNIDFETLDKEITKRKPFN